MGGTVQLDPDPWKKLLLAGDMDHNQNGGHQLNIYVSDRIAVCTVGNEEDQIFQNLSDDVCFADGNCILPGRSDLPVYLPAEERTAERTAGRSGNRLDDTDAVRTVGGMCHDDLDACGSQLYLLVSGIPQRVGGSAGECQTGRRGTAAEGTVHSASHVIFPIIFCIVFEYFQFVSVLCTDQAVDKRRAGQRNEESDLLYL